jgi:hypothetical protein
MDEAREIILCGDGEPGFRFFAWIFQEDDRIILCDFSETGAHAAGKWIAELRRRTGREIKPRVTNVYRILAENPFAIVKAPGSDHLGWLINHELKVETAIELLSRLLKRVGGDALDEEPADEERSV